MFAMEGDLPEGEEKIDVRLQDLLVKTKVWNQPGHAAKDLLLFIEVDGVAQLRQHRCRPDPRRSGADDGDAFSVGEGLVERGEAALMRLVDQGRLHGRDLDGRRKAGMDAGRHAKAVRADQAADPAQGIGPEDKGGGAAVIS
ncbi:MAG: hypothetical protein BWY77_00685 [bacterium ADurb.Bin431]|nr:MAG: hypothetical protein BWY77_00685 [bacterium ADurb.Bin431]